MIQAISAITYIENGLRQLLANGQLFGKINRSNTTLSVYLNTKAPTNPPQKSVRSSNHRPNMQNMLTGKKKPWNTKNISIEFYEPQFLKSGKPLPNILLTRVRQLPNSPTIKPFNLTIYEYRAAEMEPTDIDAILQEIVNFVNSGFYKDPFINTEKMANVTTREADIPGAVTPTKSDVQMNISNGEYGADNVVDETKRRAISLSEKQLRTIIREALVETMSVLDEGKIARAIGTAALGAGLMFGQPQQANAQLQNYAHQQKKTVTTNAGRTVEITTGPYPIYSYSRGIFDCFISNKYELGDESAYEQAVDFLSSFKAKVVVAMGEDFKFECDENDSQEVIDAAAAHSNIASQIKMCIDYIEAYSAKEGIKYNMGKYKQIIYYHEKMANEYNQKYHILRGKEQKQKSEELRNKTNELFR